MVEEEKNSDFGDYGDESSDEDDSDGEEVEHEDFWMPTSKVSDWTFR